MSERKPVFGVTNIMPSFVIGSQDLATDVNSLTASSNGIALGMILGHSAPSATLGHAVHVDDVARVHVQALDSSVPSNNDYITTVPLKWQDSQAIINRNFPEAVATGALPNNGMQPTHQLNLDNNETEKVFGFKHASFEEMLKSVVGTYLELVDWK